jgi:hypothetical protein
MPLFSDSERVLAEAIAGLTFCNPFLPERVDFERQILGCDFAPLEAPVIARRAGDARDAYASEHANVSLLTARAAKLVEGLRGRLAQGADASPAELNLYEDIVLFFLFHTFRSHLDSAILRDEEAEPSAPPRPIGFFDEFARNFAHYFEIPHRTLPANGELPHLFACIFQIRRAFYHIFNNIVGRLHARGAAEGGGVAINLHPRYSALSAVALQKYGRRGVSRQRALGHRQGACGASDWPIAVCSLQPQDPTVRGALLGRLSPAAFVGSVAHAH